MPVVNDPLVEGTTNTTPSKTIPTPSPAGDAELSDSDDPSEPIPPDVICKRRGCNISSANAVRPSRKGERCIYHAGQPIFHEGTKGWTCCKKRVLEFDEFLNMEGCKEKSGHLFIGKKKVSAGEEKVLDVR